MQDVGIEVEAVRPAHRSCGPINRCAGEGDVIVECCENAGQCAREVEFADKPVREHDAQRTSSDVFDLGHSSENSHMHSLLEGLNGQQRSRYLPEVPVPRQLGFVRGGPHLDESCGCLGQLAAE